MFMRGVIFWTTIAAAAIGVATGLMWGSPGTTHWVKYGSGVVLVAASAIIFASAPDYSRRKTRVAALAMMVYGIAQFVPDARWSLMLTAPAMVAMWMAVFRVPHAFFPPTVTPPK